MATRIETLLHPLCFVQHLTLINSRLSNYCLLVIHRREWDGFITHDADPHGSRIPAGWVIPSQPSSDDWKRYMIDREHQEENKMSND